MKNDTIIALCSLTGNIARPWVSAGYRAVLVDPQHPETIEVNGVRRVSATVENACRELYDTIDRAAFVAAFPPCTDLAVSGARWWPKKREANPAFQDDALALVNLCVAWAEKSGAPWFVENPIGALSRLWRKPDHIFNPWEYAGHEPADCYTKRTCLWVGGGFVMPPKFPIGAGVLAPPKPDSRIHTAPPGPNRANFRSATPMGFARAVFEANKP